MLSSRSQRKNWFVLPSPPFLSYIYKNKQMKTFSDQKPLELALNFSEAEKCQMWMQDLLSSIQKVYSVPFLPFLPFSFPFVSFLLTQAKETDQINKE